MESNNPIGNPNAFPLGQPAGNRSPELIVLSSDSSDSSASDPEMDFDELNDVEEIGDEQHEEQQNEIDGTPTSGGMSTSGGQQEDKDDDGSNSDNSMKSITIHKNNDAQKEDESDDSDDDEVEGVPDRILCADRELISGKGPTAVYRVKYAVQVRVPGRPQPKYEMWDSEKLAAVDSQMIVKYWENLKSCKTAQAEARGFLPSDLYDDSDDDSEEGGAGGGSNKGASAGSSSNSGGGPSGFNVASGAYNVD